MNEKINIQELIQLLSDRQGISTQDAETFIKEFFLLIQSGLERDKYVKVKGLGTFKLIDVDNRESVDVNTGERIEIQGHTKVSFTPENALKELVNRPFSHFEAVVLNENVTFDDSAEEDERSVAEVQKMDAPLPVEKEMDAKELECPDLPGDDEKIEQTVELGQPEVAGLAEKAAQTETRAETVKKEPTENPVEQQMSNRISNFHEEESATSGRESGSGRLFIGIVTAVMIGCVCVVLALYWNTMFPEKDMLKDAASGNAEKSGTETVEGAAAEAMPTDICMRETAVPQKKEAIQTQQKKEIEQAARQTQQIKKEKTAPAKTLKADSVSYIIVGTQTSYTMKEGETLTKVALRFYGTKALWPYIVKHNKAVIKNPDNVPYGTVIQIPKLKKKL